MHKWIKIKHTGYFEGYFSIWECMTVVMMHASMRMLHIHLKQTHQCMVSRFPLVGSIMWYVLQTAYVKMWPRYAAWQNPALMHRKSCSAYATTLISSTVKTNFMSTVFLWLYMVSLNWAGLYNLDPKPCNFNFGLFWFFSILMLLTLFRIIQLNHFSQNLNKKW